VPCTAVQAGRKVGAWQTLLRFATRPWKPSRRPWGSVRGSEAILAYASAILEAFPGQGQMAESQFRPLPVPQCPVVRTTHSTSNGFRENRGTGVDFPSSDPIIRLGEERKRGNEGDGNGDQVCER
jgi:hypothetical protein